MGTVEAPKRIGNRTRPPRPKVNASGAVQVKISSGCGSSRYRANVSHTARMSRWNGLHPPLELALGSEGHDVGEDRHVFPGGLEFLNQPRVGQRVADLGLLDDGG